MEELATYQSKNLKEYEEKSGKKLARILVVIEEFPSSISSLNFDIEYKKEGSPAYKYHQLMRISRTIGIWFDICTESATKENVPSVLIPAFTNKNIFRVSKAMAAYFFCRR